MSEPRVPRDDLNALRDLRTSCARIVELVDTIVYRPQTIDATVARSRLVPAIHLLITRAQRGLDVLGGTP